MRRDRALTGGLVVGSGGVVSGGAASWAEDGLDAEGEHADDRLDMCPLHSICVGSLVRRGGFMGEGRS